MRRRHTQVAGIGFFAGLAFLAVMASTWVAFAADAPFKMGIIDPQAILEKSAAGKRALAGLKEYAQARQKLIGGDEEELKNLEKQLKEQESTLSEVAKREKQNQFRAKLAEYQKKGSEFQQELAAKQKELVDEYMKKIQAATKAVAEKGGYSLVVDRGSETTLKIVIYNKDSVDMTDQVLKEFEKQNK